MKALLLGYSSALTTAGAARTQPFATNGANSTWASSLTASQQQPLPHAITLDRLRVNVLTAPGAGNNIVFTVLKNGSATGLTCTISDTATSAQDLTHSVSFAAGDSITIQMNRSASATAPGKIWWSGRQDATNLFAIIGGINGTATGFLGIAGTITTSATSGDAGLIVPCSGTVKNLYVHASGTLGNFTVYKNGVAQTLTTGSMGSADVNDTTHSFTVAAGDRILIRNTGTGREASWSVSFDPDTDGYSFIGQIDNNHNNSASATTYYQLQGDGDGAWDGTETNVLLKLQACTILGIYAQTSASPGVSPKAFTFTARLNQADTSAAVTINAASSAPNDGTSGGEASTTGLSISVADDDNVNMKCVPASTPTALHAYTSILIQVPSDITTSQTITGVARITKTVLQTIAGLARITATTLKTITGVSRIQKSASQTITGIARITATTARTISGVARITASTSRNITGVARIQKSATQTITGIARLSIGANQTIAGLARITASTLKTITGVARITNTTAKTISGKSRIQITTPQTILGKSRITAVVPKTITGQSRITATTSQTTTGKSRIQRTTSQTIAGLARVRQTVLTTILGVARIQRSASQTITGRSRVQIHSSRVLTGLARIEATVSQNITGAARLEKSGSQTITGVAKLLPVNNAKQQTITGVARIVVRDWEHGNSTPWETPLDDGFAQKNDSDPWEVPNDSEFATASSPNWYQRP